VAAPKHDLLHRLKRLWRFTDNRRVDALTTQAAFVPHVVARYHGRLRDLFINVALYWRIPKSRARDPRRKRPEKPWYLATSLKDAHNAASWYWQ
jgi:iron-sulfur cluster repair protein YtfE (RIC family)